MRKYLVKDTEGKFFIYETTKEMEIGDKKTYLIGDISFTVVQEIENIIVVLASKIK